MCINKVLFMTVIPLMGGLGNQLFQIAFAHRLNKEGVQVAVSYSILRGVIFQRILGWTIHPNSNTEALCKALNIKLVKLRWFDYFTMFFTYIKKKSNIKSVFDSRYKEVVLASRSHLFRLIVPGYFQSTEHLEFDDISLIAKKFYQLNCNISSKQQERIAHVRRGDFSKGTLMKKSYYINILKQSEIEKISFVGDDSEYILKNYGGVVNNPSHLDSKSDIFEDFCQIANAKVIVASNSTFSYMACCASDATEIHFPESIGVNLKTPFPMDDRFVLHKVEFE